MTVAGVSFLIGAGLNAGAQDLAMLIVGRCVANCKVQVYVFLELIWNETSSHSGLLFAEFSLVLVSAMAINVFPYTCPKRPPSSSGGL